MVLKLSSFVDLKAGISMHPAHTMMGMILGLNEEDLYKDVKCPQMFMPAKDDHENTKIGGLVKILPISLMYQKSKTILLLRNFEQILFFWNIHCNHIGW